MSNFRHRLIVVALSVFLAVSPILVYIIGSLRNTVLLEDVQKQVAAIPPYPSVALIKSSFADERGSDTQRELIWRFEYRADVKADELMNYYRTMLPAHSGFMGYYSSAKEGDMNLVIVTVYYTYDVRFDFLRYTP